VRDEFEGSQEGKKGRAERSGGAQRWSKKRVEFWKRARPDVTGTKRV